MIMEEALLPPEAVQTVDDIDRALRKVEEHLGAVLPKCTRESFEQLSFVERASTFVALSKTLAVLFGVYLKTNGVSPDDHPANRELGRVGLYQDNVQKAVDRSTGPQMRTSSLDVRATNRFINRAIPDLSEEQRKGLRELGKKGAAKRRQERGTMNSTPKKRPSGMTIAEEAAAFLVEATKKSAVAAKTAAFLVEATKEPCETTKESSIVAKTAAFLVGVTKESSIVAETDLEASSEGNQL